MGWLGTWLLPERCTHNPLVLTFSPSSCQRLLFLSALVRGSARAWSWLATTEPFHVSLLAPVYPDGPYSHHAQNHRSPSPNHHPMPTALLPPLSPSNAFCFLSETRYPPHITLMPASALRFPSFGSMDVPLARSLHHHLLGGGTWGGRQPKAGKQQQHEVGKGQEAAEAQGGKKARSSRVRGEKRV